MREQIPDHWTADHALSFVAFLDDLIAAVWARHGPAMADALQRRGNTRPDDCATDHPPHDIDSIIPF